MEKLLSTDTDETGQRCRILYIAGVISLFDNVCDHLQMSVQQNALGQIRLDVRTVIPEGD